MKYPSQSAKISKSLKIMGGRFVPSLILSLCTFGFSLPAMGEGSRSLYPSTADSTQYRSQIEWTTGTLLGPSGAAVHIQRRTLLRVYANAGEYILLGSSAINVPGGQSGIPAGGRGDIVLYESSEVTFNTVGDEELPEINTNGVTKTGTPLFTCNGNGRVQENNNPNNINLGDRIGNTNRGIINNRTEELAGPQAADGSGGGNRYPPCYYQVPSGEGGIYYVAFFGTHGPNVINRNPDGAQNIGDLAGTRTNSDGNNDLGAQQTSVAAWDITVRSSDPSSTTDINGRVWTYYMSTSTGQAEDRPTSFQIYMVTNDGYTYTTKMDRISPNGFTIYGNQRGFLNGDGTTLFRDVVASRNSTDGRITNNLFDLMGDVQVTYPQFPLFFNEPDDAAKAALDRVGLDGQVSGSGTPDPIAPEVRSVSFAGNATGTADADDALLNTNNAGTLTIESSIDVGNFEVIISGTPIPDRDSPPNVTDLAFDPTLSTNRTYTGVLNGGTNPAGVTVSGRTITINWDGRDNAGNFFPAGENYPIHVRVRGGEYHFPMIDVEHYVGNGPILRLMNAPGTYPTEFTYGATTGFYDDRVYLASNGEKVDDLTGPEHEVGDVLCHGVGDAPDGSLPDWPFRSDPFIGYNTTTNQRDFGNISLEDTVSNPNESCAGTFGDKKGLDLWTFFPSERRVGFLNVIVPTPQLLLVKRITAVNGVDLTGFNPDTSTNDDEDKHWPSPDDTYLRGSLSQTNIEPGDEIEFTIYFLSSEGVDTENATICDAVPGNMTFAATGFNDANAAAGGATGFNLGIALALDSNNLPTGPTDYFTNVDDGDRGQYIPPGMAAPLGSGCFKQDADGNLLDEDGGLVKDTDKAPVLLEASDNTNGLIVVDVVTDTSTPSSLPRAVPPGNNPASPGSYGFIRFRAVVN